jgi:hypothetical protein
MHPLVQSCIQASTPSITMPHAEHAWAELSRRSLVDCVRFSTHRTTALSRLFEASPMKEAPVTHPTPSLLCVQLSAVCAASHTRKANGATELHGCSTIHCCHCRPSHMQHPPPIHTLFPIAITQPHVTCTLDNDPIPCLRILNPDGTVVEGAKVPDVSKVGGAQFVTIARSHD